MKSIDWFHFDRSSNTMRLYVYSFLTLHCNQRLLELKSTKLSLSTTVIELKHLLLERFGVPYFEQRLTFAAKELRDNQTLSDHRGLRANKTLHMLPVLELVGTETAVPLIPNIEERAKLQREADDLRMAKELARQLADSSDSSSSDSPDSSDSSDSD